MLKCALVDGFPLLTTKKMFTRGIVRELEWMIRGSTDAKELMDDHVHIWDGWQYPDHGIGPGYGFQWRNFGASYDFLDKGVNEGEQGEALARLSGRRSVMDTSAFRQEFREQATREYDAEERRIEGVDQLRMVVEMIQNNPESRRIIMSAWNPVDVPDMKLPPCHVLYHFSVWGDTLHMLMYQRSCDTFLGVPFNIAASSLLLSVIAHVTGLKPGVFTHQFGDLHIYDNHREVVQTQLARSPRALPILELDARLKDGGFDALLDFKYEDMKLIDYNPHPAIKAEVSI